MIALDAAGKASESAGKRLWQLLERPGILRTPRAHNGMAAIQARAARFEALYLSGAAMSASMGLPVLVDGDTGYGEVLNVMRMAELYATIARDGTTRAVVDRMQTRATLYATIRYHDYEALDASIVSTILP